MKHNTLPDPFESEIRIAQGHLQTNRLAEAQQIFRDILNEVPRHPAANLGLGMLLHQAGTDEPAIEHLSITVEACPQHLDARFFLAISLYRLHHFEDSARQYEVLIRDHPDVAEAHNNLGNIKYELSRNNEAEKHYLQALKLKPSLTEAHKGLSNLYRELGRLDEAKTHAIKAIEYEPYSAEAHLLLTSVTKFSRIDSNIRAIESAYNRENVTDADKILLAHALGKAFHDVKQYSRAFQYWREGNSLRHKLSEYKIDTALAEMHVIKKVFSPTICNRVDRTRTTQPKLLFILGMPRSGTTLTEQILSSHSLVHGAGELNLEIIIRNLIGSSPQDLKKLNPANLEIIREKYLQEIAAIAGGAAYVSDKLPANFLYIGAISQMFPDAKIIHCCRNALDTGLSCFMNYFNSDRLCFTCDLTNLGRYYRHYLDLMEYWSQVQTAAIYDIEYESLITETEREVGRLLEFCKLPFEAGCLKFYENKRSVKTVSAAQVRQPIYKDSLQGWKHYELELQPLKTALEKSPHRFASRVTDIISRFYNRS